MQPKTRACAPAILATALVVPVLGAPTIAFSEESGTTTRRVLNADGSTSMSYSTHVTGLGAQVGVDMSAPGSSIVPDPVETTGSISGTAYARISIAKLPDWLMWQKGAVNVVVDPSAEESRVATSFSRTWTVNDGLKATLADKYEVAQSTSGSGWNTEKSLSVKLEDTGTTLAIGAKASDANQKFLGKLSARQEIFEKFSVTTSVSETDGNTPDKSIKAGFSHRW